MKTLRFFALLILSYLPFDAISQHIEITPEMQENIRLYNSKIEELIAKHNSNGFKIIQEEKLPLRSGNEMIIHMPLYEGDWYHFCFIGDPSSEKIKATLFLEGLGDLIQDKLIVRKENEFWTEFSFICPRSGSYELTLFQKNEISRPLSYLTVFKKVIEAASTLK